MPTPPSSLVSARRAPRRRVVRLLRKHTYQEVAEQTGWSRGAIYRVAVAEGVRKHEDRIREKAAERKRRRLEFIQDVMGTTAKADVLSFLDGLPDNSVALTVSSPPYNLGKKYGDAAGADLMAALFYEGWVMGVISELARVTRPGGVVFLQVGSTRDWQDRLMPLDVMLFEHLRRAGLQFQSRVVWTLPHGLTPERRLAERYETALVFSKGEPSVFNPTPARVPQKNPGKRAFKGPNKGELSSHPFGAFPTNVWSDISNVRHNHPDRRFGSDARDGQHPAQFPTALAKRAILLYTNPGDLVCDPFSGSGATHQAVIETGRAFVGADLFYEDLRRKRIAAAAPDMVSHLPGVTEESLAIWNAETVRVDVPAVKHSAKHEAMLRLENETELGLFDVAV